MRCPDCYKIAVMTPWKPCHGLETFLREFTCPKDHVFYVVLSYDEILQLKDRAEQAEPYTTAARMNVT